MKTIKIKDSLTVILGDGTMLSMDNCTEDVYQSILGSQDEDFVKELMMPELYKDRESKREDEDFVNRIAKSKYLSFSNNSVYIRSISDVSLPKDLAKSVLEVEACGNTLVLNSYLNFWTLVSMNPNSQARENLFWFLQKWGMTISKSGLFIAYKNVDLYSEGGEIKVKLANFIVESYLDVLNRDGIFENYYVGKSENGDYVITTSPDELRKVKGNLADLYNSVSSLNNSPTYTDNYSRKFRIKIGKTVKIKRWNCDEEQENDCSYGLHVGGKDWLSKGYFGSETLMVLVNPKDVVAVPKISDYGKMRTCSYFPVKTVERDDVGGIVPQTFSDGFSDNYITDNYISDTVILEDFINNKENKRHIIFKTLSESDRKQAVLCFLKTIQLGGKYVD